MEGKLTVWSGQRTNTGEERASKCELWGERCRIAGREERLGDDSQGQETERKGNSTWREGIVGPEKKRAKKGKDDQCKKIGSRTGKSVSCLT